jgi:hypothetical protein
MGSHARRSQRTVVRLAAALAFGASLFAATASTDAFAGGMDPTPERLILPPGSNFPAGLNCQQIAANPQLLASIPGAQTANHYPCLPDNVAFKNLVSELGFALAPSTMHTARTTGFGGFELSLEASYTHINADDYTHSGGSHIQYWHAGTQGSTDSSGNYSTVDNSPDSLLGVYTLMVRKGLPFGFELDGALGYMQNSSLWTVGGDIRWAILEGFRTGPMGYVPDLAVGSGVRTMTGTSKMYLTTIGIDAEVSKPFSTSDSGIITPYVGYQHLIILGNSAVLDSTPNVNAVSQCGLVGRNPDGSPECKNSVPAPGGGTVPNDGDFNNNITFNSVTINHERLFLGVTYRYELFFVGAQFLFDLLAPSSIDSDLSGTRQWTMSLQAGIFF